MAEKAHVNLFHYAVDKADVYEALQKNYDRDTWRQAGWDALFWLCAIAGSASAGHSDWLWIFGAIYAFERSIVRYIDNSNRNWTMHVIDWIENNKANSARRMVSTSSIDD
jgi:hypothetical protein